MDFLIDTRKRRELKQCEVARQCGLTKHRLCEYERGVRTPSRKTLLKIASALGVPDRILTAADQLPVQVRELLTFKHVVIPPAEGTLTWFTATETNPERYIAARDRLPSARFRKLVRCDSRLEADVWTALVVGGFGTYFASPIEFGYHHWWLLDGKGFALGTRKLPCLYIQVGDEYWVVWPQVPILTRRGEYRVDALVLIYVHGRRHWLAVEIDGTGHFTEYDGLRSERLEMPVVRFSADEVRRTNFCGAFLNKVRAACSPAQAA